MDKFRVWENQLTLIAEDIPTLDEAVSIAKLHHEVFPNRYHEVYRVLENGQSWGVCQWKPGDPVIRL